MRRALAAAEPVARQMRSDLTRVADSLRAEFGDGSVRVEGDGGNDVKKLASLARKYLIEGRREGFRSFMDNSANDLARFSLSVVDGPRYTEIVQAALDRLRGIPTTTGTTRPTTRASGGRATASTGATSRCTRPTGIRSSSSSRPASPGTSAS
ncbi:hypothetical protein Psuf_052230 [Phytohabitans suffuscus]|uniref:Uncharacterized protein n=1 Tax=Phytohabitans suffuscus TaxID=624315 RepID=A0A6F8YP63_9ACTN|nr:hypothetical protein [Phytohabitans suffuscus]BCB87910.1 hypothetical protein Psuf_052230 [Phytohabitans suffuscus]